MKWNLRMKAAERGIWKSSELRRMLDDLDVICLVLDCPPGDLLVAEPDKVAARRPAAAVEVASNGSPSIVKPRFNGKRPEPPV